MTRQEMITAAVFTVTVLLSIPTASRGAEGADTEAIRTIFARIDLDYPGLKNVKAALSRDDLPAAEEAYLTFWRERQDRKVLWNPSGRFSSLENRTGNNSDFFRVHPVTISWRDREKLKGQIHTDCAWADFGQPTRWTLLTMADLMLENRLVHLREEVSTAPLANPWTSTAVLDYNAGEYSGGYHPTPYVAGSVDNGVRHHRSVFFVKPDYWIVTDRLLPTGKDDPDRARTFEQLFQYIPCEMSECEDSRLFTARELKRVQVRVPQLDAQPHRRTAQFAHVRA